MSKKIERELGRLRLPELQTKYREIVGEATRCPNRAFLVRRICEALAAREPEAEPGRRTARMTGAEDRPARPPRPTAAEERPAPSPRGRFSSMTVEELHTLYQATVGRPTDSTNRAYLCWKVREAEKGRIPIGPRETRTPDQEAHTDARILPFRMDARSVRILDTVWRAQGLKSRTEFFRRALAHYLAHIEEREAAARFAAP